MSAPLLARLAAARELLDDLPEDGGEAPALAMRKCHCTKSAAAILDIPYRTFMDVLNRGEIAYLRIGRYTLIPDEALDAYIRAVTVPARCQPRPRVT